MATPKLTSEQLQKLHQIEPLLHDASVKGDYEAAQKHMLEVQDILRVTGHETRLMQAKLWFFEAAMRSGHFSVSTPGFIGIRAKAATTTRLYIEATALLAICYLRQKNLPEAEPFIAEVLKRNRNIRSESRRKQFMREVVSRFEEEGLLGALSKQAKEDFDAEDIQRLAAVLVGTRNEDEMFAEMGKAIPPESVAFLLKVDLVAKRGLTAKEILYLPGEAQIMEKAELGRTTFRSFKHVLWKSLCDPESDIYKAWFNEGLSFVLNRKYLVTAISAALLHIGIGIKALIVSAVALVMKFGLEVYCVRFKPDFIMETR